MPHLSDQSILVYQVMSLLKKHSLTIVLKVSYTLVHLMKSMALVQLRHMYLEI